MNATAIADTTMAAIAAEQRARVMIDALRAGNADPERLTRALLNELARAGVVVPPTVELRQFIRTIQKTIEGGSNAATPTQ